ncbi:hypothetical protein, partial [Pseudomonas viridiflava]|uniref:hypothetical protein n=1 Tax=Pseudomonas viridiflava TaxID=33069 RepID=UPI0019CFC037
IGHIGNQIIASLRFNINECLHSVQKLVSYEGDLIDLYSFYLMAFVPYPNPRCGQDTLGGCCPICRRSSARSEAIPE